MIDYKIMDERITNATSILITAPKNVNNETLLSIVSFNDVLSSHYNKYSLIAFTDALSVDQQKLLTDVNFDIQQITNHIEGLKYIIQIPKDSEGKIDSVTYDEDDKNFYFHIMPGSGNFNVDNISILQDEPEFDFIFVFGTEEAVDIGSIYEENQKVFDKDRMLYIKSDSGSMDVIFDFIDYLHLDLQPDKAQLVLNGLVLQGIKDDFANSTENFFVNVAKLVSWQASFKLAMDQAKAMIGSPKQQKPKAIPQFSDAMSQFPKSGLNRGFKQPMPTKDAGNKD